MSLPKNEYKRLPSITMLKKVRFDPQLSSPFEESENSGLDNKTVSGSKNNGVQPGKRNRRAFSEASDLNQLQMSSNLSRLKDKTQAVKPTSVNKKRKSADYNESKSFHLRYCNYCILLIFISICAR